MEWYNIKDKRPKKGAKVLLCVKHFDNSEYNFYIYKYSGISQGLIAKFQSLYHPTYCLYASNEFRWTYIDNYKF